MPENNLIEISSKKNANFFIFLTKIYLKKFESVELHALGKANTTAVRVAENLNRFGYVTIKKIMSFTVKSDESPESKKIKSIITLKRSASFFLI
jgi:DNA-binding protein